MAVLGSWLPPAIPLCIVLLWCGDEMMISNQLASDQRHSAHWIVAPPTGHWIILRVLSLQQKTLLKSAMVSEGFVPIFQFVPLLPPDRSILQSMLCPNKRRWRPPRLAALVRALPPFWRQHSRRAAAIEQQLVRLAGWRCCSCGGVSQPAECAGEHGNASRKEAEWICGAADCMAQKVICLLLICSLLCAKHPLFASDANANNSSTTCAPDSFVCPGHPEHCIPAEWVGDGELDCEDGADEQQLPDNAANGTTPGEPLEKPDPFSMATAAPIIMSLDEWEARVEAALPELFTRPSQSSQLLLQGCPHLRTAKGPWERLQMFICELLGPALRDHPQCLTHSARCPLPPATTPNASLACALLSQSSAHFGCLEEQPPAECSESALEMLAPLSQESKYWALEIGCSPADGAASAGRVQPWDALAILGQAKLLCSDKEQQQGDGAEEDLAEPIWAKVCDRQDVLAANQKCLLELGQREAVKCGSRPSERENSSCALLEAFGRNLDCSLHSLNELCPVEAQEAVVGIQEQLNDEAIARQCFQQNELVQQQQQQQQVPHSVDEHGKAQFALNPAHKPCTADQEETAVLCLAELADLPARWARLEGGVPTLGALLSNRSALGPVCALFERYQQCLQTRVFANSSDGRCALNSPLNGLARVGLSPICTHSTALAQSSPDCLASPALSNCQAPVQALGHAVGAILQGGSNGAAWLCKAFYALREAFRCGRQAISEKCQKEALDGNLVELLATLESIGREEGCPGQVPNGFDALLLTVPTGAVPQARPLPESFGCPPAQQQQFQACVHPLSAFQPHPLAVIKQPRLIANACQAFANFTLCQSALPPECVPLWARGLAGMFEFACGPGNGLFLEIRQCLRRVTAQPEVRDCVLAFSRASPGDACPSAGQLLACSLGPIEAKCGAGAGQFVRDYVGRFVNALEPNCSLSGGEPNLGPSAVSVGSNCTEAQAQQVQQCAAPLDQLRGRLNGLFQGGLQTLLKNLNGLATLFQEGCSLGSQFRTCIAPLLNASFGGQQCAVSSCLLAAGTGICDQPNVGATIDSQLGCVFRQVSNPEFGQCVRTTLGPLRQLNLSALRAALPAFVDCVQPVVLRECGPVPLNVLRVLGSKTECPLNAQQQQQAQIVTMAQCTPALRQSRQECQSRLLVSKYSFLPGALLNGKMSELCADLDKLRQCEQETRPCEAEEPYGRTRALRALGTTICSSRTEFDRIMGCLVAASQSEEGRACLAPFSDGLPPEQLCAVVNASSQCLAPQMFAECGPEALELAFSAGNEYLGQIVPAGKCQLETPALALQTGCPEQQLIAFLDCESGLDRFRPRPIALIGNQSRWDEFCTTAQNQFRPCVEKLECRPEPATSAALVLHEMVCEREIARSDQRQFGQCLLAVTEQPSGQQCLDQFRAVDLLAKDAGPKVCAAVDRLLQCLAKMINTQCGEGALLHVFDLYNGWANAFQPGCALLPSEIGPPKGQKQPDIDFANDDQPAVLVNKSVDATVEWVEGSSAQPEQDSTVEREPNGNGEADVKAATIDKAHSMENTTMTATAITTTTTVVPVEETSQKEGGQQHSTPVVGKTAGNGGGSVWRYAVWNQLIGLLCMLLILIG